MKWLITGPELRYRGIDHSDSRACWGIWESLAPNAHDHPVRASIVPLAKHPFADLGASCDSSVYCRHKVIVTEFGTIDSLSKQPAKGYV